MDEKVVRATLEEVQASLKENESEHEVLLHLLQGLEGWLKIRGKGTETIQPNMFVEPRHVRKSNQPMGKISMRSAIKRVLQDAHGNPLHAKEIWLRVQALGAMTSAKDPVGIIDLTCVSLQKEGVEKAEARQYRWVGKVENNGGNTNGAASPEVFAGIVTGAKSG